jgi:hypothetical protein
MFLFSCQATTDTNRTSINILAGVLYHASIHNMDDGKTPALDMEAAARQARGVVEQRRLNAILEVIIVEKLASEGWQFETDNQGNWSATK